MLAALTAATLLVAGVGTANADPKHPYPSRAQVDAAKQAVAAKARSVAEIRAALVVAQQQANAADTAAEIASERYNGAVFALQKARQEVTHAKAEAARARADVAAQRKHIAQLATASYQQGSDLNAVTAMLGADGPTGLMDKVGVVQTAGDSMQARYEQFQAVKALADVYSAKAQRAEERQRRLAAQARQARDRAGALAASAQAKASEVTQQRDSLIQQLAAAQHVSVSLARQRQDALERIAREKAAAAARAKALAEQRAAAAAARKAAAQERAREAARQAQEAQQASTSTDTTSPPVVPPAPVGNPKGPRKRIVRAAIAFAKAQIGKPYEWGATGPDTFDCSGLMLRAWQSAGVYLPRTAAEQYWAGRAVSTANLRRGDLIFWSYDGTPAGIHHVALYIGNGDFIEAPHTGAFVRYNSIFSEYPDFAVRL